jgi:hypothetical protein
LQKCQQRSSRQQRRARSSEAEAFSGNAEISEVVPLRTMKKSPVRSEAAGRGSRDAPYNWHVSKLALAPRRLCPPADSLTSLLPGTVYAPPHCLLGHPKWIAWPRGSAPEPPSRAGTALPSERGMTEPTDEEIRIRAHQLWEQAGKPEGREEEFWHAAEQELRNADKSSPLRTPDTL